MPRKGGITKLGDKCTNCGVEIQKHNAHNRWSTSQLRYYLETKCKSCAAAKRASNPSRSKEFRTRQQLAFKWGLTLEEHRRRSELQFNGCAICKQPCKTRERLSVDHNHKTGVIRDLLCNRCNIVLGWVNDDEGLLFDMIEYLKRHEEKIAG